MKQTCLEVSTLDIKLNPLENDASTKGNVSHVLFYGKRNRAEIFLPLQDKGIILKMSAKGNW